MNFKINFRLVFLLVLFSSNIFQANDFENSPWGNNPFSEDYQRSPSSNVFTQDTYQNEPEVYELNGPPGPPDPVPINEYIPVLLLVMGVIAWKYGRKFQNS